MLSARGGKDTMVIDGVPRGFVYGVLAAATLVGALEMTAARGSASGPKAESSWTSPLRDMDQAIARGDVASAVTAEHKVYQAAIASRRWEGFLAAGDAILRLGEATQRRSRAEPEARRLYLPALFRAHSQQSLDGVLLATEAFARLGDGEVVEMGLRMARDLAGSDPEAQKRVHRIEDRSLRSAAVGRERAGETPTPDGGPAHVVR
jgi:hypothetical protein